MPIQKYLRQNGEIFYPVTHTKSTYDNDGKVLEDRLVDMERDSKSYTDTKVEGKSDKTDIEAIQTALDTEITHRINEVKERKLADEEIWKSIDEKFSHFSPEGSAGTIISGGGSGTEADPYIILSESDLKLIKNHLDAHYVLGGSVYLNNPWIPFSEVFTGSLDGNGYTIYNMNISVASNLYGAFIGINNGTIRNIRFENVNINCSGNYIATIVGKNDINGVVEKCAVVSGTISGNYYVGGICAQNNGTIKNSYNKSTISTITSTHGMGGITGENNGLIQNTYSIGQLISDKLTVDGYCGAISGCENGVEHSYGLFPYRIVGDDAFDLSTENGTSLNKEEFTQQDTFKYWDFENIWQIQDGQCPTLKISKMSDENILYHFWFNHAPSTTDIIPVSTIQDFRNIRCNLSGHYILTNDIIMKDSGASAELTSIGSEETPFTGILDGNGYKISGFNITSANSYYYALFEVNEGTIKNLVVTANQIGKNGTENAAAVVGTNNGTISQVGIEGGTITAANTAGLAVVNNSTISNSYVNGVNLAGSGKSVGITVTNNGLISKVYSKQNFSVTPTSKAAIAIDNTGMVEHSHALVTVTFVASDDTLKSQNGNSVKTASALNKRETYTNWDFDNIWYIENSTPKLLITLHTPQEVQIANIGSTVATLNDTIDKLTIAILEE